MLKIWFPVVISMFIVLVKIFDCHRSVFIVPPDLIIQISVP